MKKELIQIRISENDKSKLDEKAKKEGMTMSEAVRYLVRKWIDEVKND